MDVRPSVGVQSPVMTCLLIIIPHFKNNNKDNTCKLSNDYSNYTGPGASLILVIKFLD